MQADSSTEPSQVPEQLITTIRGVYEAAGCKMSGEQQLQWTRTLDALPQAEAGFLLNMLSTHLGCDGHPGRAQAGEMIPVLEQVLQCA